MQTIVKFRFEPVLITTLFLIDLSAAYGCYHAYYSAKFQLAPFLVLCAMPFLLACVVLPLLMMMARSIPAIALTDDYLINNYGGFSIEWHDILEIHRTKSYRGSGGIVINLKNPEKYFDSPIKKISYQLRQLFSANDITIPLNLVAGNDDEILQTITAYWNKNAR